MEEEELVELLNEVKEALELLGEAKTELIRYIQENCEKTFIPSKIPEAQRFAIGHGGPLGGGTTYYYKVNERINKLYYILDNVEDRLRFILIENRPIE